MAISISEEMKKNRLNTFDSRIRYGDESVVSVVAPEISEDVKSWADKCAKSSTLKTLEGVGEMSAQKMANTLFLRLKTELHSAGFTDAEIFRLKARIDACKDDDEIQKVITTLRKELQARLSAKTDKKIVNAQKKITSSKKSQDSERKKESIYKEILSFGKVLDKFLADLKSGVRTDYSTIFNQAKAVESIINSRVAQLRDFGAVAQDKFNISEEQLKKFNGTAKNIYKYATALDLQRALKQKYKSKNCGQIVVKSGKRTVYISLDEDERRSTYFSSKREGRGFDLAIADKEQMMSMTAGQFRESDIKQYKNEIFTIEKRIMMLLGDDFFGDDRYSITYDPVDGYKISSNGVELSDAPEEINVKLYDNGDLDQLYIKDNGKTASIELEGSTPAEVGKDVSQAKKELAKAKEISKESSDEME
jgi:hypothetical protein